MRILAAVFSLLAIAPPSPTTVTLSSSGKATKVAAADNGAILSIADVVAGLGGSTQDLPGASVAAQIGDHRVVAADGVATVAYDNQVVTLTRPVRRFSGVLFAPWELFEKVIFPAAGITADYDRAAGRILVHPPAPRGGITSVDVAHVAGLTQVVFRGSAPIPGTLAVSGSTATVTFAPGTPVPFPERDFDDALLAKVTFSGSVATLSFRASAVSANGYALASPDRYVVEVTAGKPSPIAPAPAPASSVRTVVIDPGHGGDETGAVGPDGVAEKTVTLDIARRVAADLSASPGVHAVLTRNSDTQVALDERAAIANHEKAAVFVSIHANASRAAGARGSETYYLSLSGSDKLANALAQTENAESAPAGPSAPGSSAGDLDFILWDMAQAAHLNESAQLAESIQDELNGLLHTENRGIKQAPFRVLVGATMPAVLVETAFISNGAEEKELTQGSFQQKIADAIARAVVAFLKAHPAGPPTTAAP